MGKPFGADFHHFSRFLETFQIVVIEPDRFRVR